MVYLNRDWTQVSTRSIRDQYGDEESNILIEDNVITFTRSGRSNLLAQPRSSLQRVQYRLVDNKLVRRHWRSLDQAAGEEPIQIVLLNNVESFEVEFQNAVGQPIETWPIAQGTTATTPIVLAFRLELPDMGKITRLLEVPRGVI